MDTSSGRRKYFEIGAKVKILRCSHAQSAKCIGRTAQIYDIPGDFSLKRMTPGEYYWKEKYPNTYWVRATVEGDNKNLYDYYWEIEDLLSIQEIEGELLSKILSRFKRFMEEYE